MISGDTMFSENLIKFAKGTDLLIHEVMPGATPESQRSGNERSLIARWHHTNAEDAGRVFARVRPKLAVYTHLILGRSWTLQRIIDRTRTTYDGPLVIGEDMMVIEIGDEVRVKKPLL